MSYHLSSTKGKHFESIALSYLVKNNYKIISKNYKSPFGEIDIIATKNNCLVAIEVKGGVYPHQKINKTKIDKIIKTLQFFIYQSKNKLNYSSMQIDTILIYTNGSNYTIEHITNITI
ncbi:MAG: YraN family protein [bacterium]